MRKNHTTEELKYFEKATDGLILWLFTTDEKRYAIEKTIMEAYDEGKESNPNKD